MISSPFFLLLPLLVFFDATVVRGHQLLQESCLASDGTCNNEENPEADDNFDESPCTNDDPDCEFWAGLEPSECDENPEFMNQVCRKACNLCTPPLDLGVDQDLRYDTEFEEEIEEIINKTYEYFEKVVMVEPEYEKVRDHCKNKEADCSYWASIGECENNHGFMSVNCAPACQTCDQLTYEARCPMDNLPPNAWQPGDLNKMFEKITTEEEFKKYQPQILSRPSYPEGESKDNTDYKIGPWVVVLENFASPAECDKLIELGGIEGYERSSDVGELNFDGTYEDDINEGRTSMNAWCSEKCATHPAAQSVIERIENVTGIPRNNSEDLQLLRYEVGQYYNQHHDYIDFEKDQQVGVRLMTLYLYLSDVEEGGGTRFPLLDMTVQPKRGRALLWPSVLDEHPDEEDELTEHQALPVIKGMKYGANAWMHQRDFKGPNDKGC